MTLTVTTFTYDPVSRKMKASFYPEQPGRDLAGFEACRTGLWGSDTVRSLGATFLPRLSTGDLQVYAEELDAFEAECRLLLDNVDRIHEALGWAVEFLSQRLDNFLHAISEARRISGGVWIS